MSFLVLSGCTFSKLSPVQERENGALQDATAYSGSNYSKLVCEIHGTKLNEKFVPVYHGFAVALPKYMKAKLKHFPTSFLDVKSGRCEGIGEDEVGRMVCRDCRAEERKWNKKNGLDTP